MNELITIVVPIYNVEKYLKQCLESLISQTYKNIEIILINDGSTDGSKKICEEFAKKDTRIIVINQKIVVCLQHEIQELIMQMVSI